MYTAKPALGRFEGNASQFVARVVEDLVGNGGGEEIGDVEGFGFYAYIQGKRYGFILSNDSQGFVSVESFPRQEAQERWLKLVAAYQDYCDEATDEER